MLTEQENAKDFRHGIAKHGIRGDLLKTKPSAGGPPIGGEVIP